MSITTIAKLKKSERKELTKGVIEVEGKAMNRTALGIVDAILKLFPEISFDELKEMLPDTINPSAPKNYKSIFKPYTDKLYGVIQTGSIRKEYQDLGLDLNTSHFLGEGETFMTKDGVEVLVSRTWETKDTLTGEHDLQNLINHVAQYGVRVVSFESKKPFARGSYSLNVINPKLLAILQEPKKKKSRLWIWILIIALVIVTTLFLTRKTPSESNQDKSHTESSLPAEKSETLSIVTLKELEDKLKAGTNTKGNAFNFHEILFDKSKHNLRPESENYLQDVLQLLKDVPALKLKIVGHTSKEGNETFNDTLSFNRANTVANYLISKGIESSRLETGGKGSSEPLADEANEEGKKLNRRIQFIVTDDGVNNAQ